MNDDLKLKPDLIINPQTGDVDTAEEILDEIFQVLKKHNCALVSQPQYGVNEPTMVLGKSMGFGERLRAIAHVRQITPDFIEWKQIDWTPKALRTQ